MSRERIRQIEQEVFRHCAFRAEGLQADPRKFHSFEAWVIAAVQRLYRDARVRCIDADMTTDEMLDINTRLCKGLGKKPGESLEDAARRAFKEDPPNAVRRAVALILLNGGPPEKVWDRMKRASLIFEPETLPV